MIELENVLFRMGLTDLEVLVNPVVYELISLYEKNPNKKSIISMILKTNDMGTFLMNKISRNLIFDFLTDDEINDLIRQLGISLSVSSRTDLQYTKFSSSRIQILSDFLGIEITSFIEEITVNECIQKVIPEYSLFFHQEVAVMNVLNVLDKKNRVLLHMPTGSGKTRTSMNLISQFFRRVIAKGGKQIVLWLADTEELCDQAADEFIKAWKNLGSCPLNVYRFYGDHEQDFENINTGIIISGLQKMLSFLSCNQEVVYKLASSTSLVFFDEAHKIIAPTYKHLVELFTLTVSQKTKLIGLTATPGRSIVDESENDRLASFFDYSKVTLRVEGYDNPVEYLQDEGYLAQVEYHEIPYYSENLSLTQSEIDQISSGNDISIRILKKLGLDAVRNLKVLNKTLDEVKLNSHIIIFACSVENAIAINSLLQYKDIKSGIVISKQDKTTRRLTIEKYRTGELDVIVNYGVLTTGFDVPSTNVAIIARPTMSLTLYSQMVGRAIRGEKAGGNSHSRIYTVVDNIIPGFRSVVKSFDHWDDVWK